jgi:hypothetical protein
MDDTLLKYLKRHGILNPCDYLVSEEGKRLRKPTSPDIFISRREVEEGLDKLWYM